MPGYFTSGERTPSTHWLGGWAGPKADVDVGEKRKIPSLPPQEIKNQSSSLQPSYYTDCT